MKFEIKVGEEFDIREESVVHTEVHPDGTFVKTHKLTRRSKMGGGMSFKKMLLWLTVVATVSFFAASIAYGKATGDYSVLKSFVDALKAILDLVIGAVINQK